MLVNQLNAADDFVHFDTPEWAQTFQEQFAIFHDMIDMLTTKTALIEYVLTTNRQVLQVTQEALLATQRQLAKATARNAFLDNPVLMAQPISSLI